MFLYNKLSEKFTILIEIMKLLISIILFSISFNQNHEINKTFRNKNELFAGLRRHL